MLTDQNHFPLFSEKSPTGITPFRLHPAITELANHHPPILQLLQESATYPEQLSHGKMAAEVFAATAQATLPYLPKSLAEEISYLIPLSIPGATLHDIGKIAPSISSLFYVNPGPDTDSDREKNDICQQHLHPYFSQELMAYIFRSIPEYHETIFHQIQLLGGHHHETTAGFYLAADGHRSASYPRPKLITTDFSPAEFFELLVFEAADKVVSMGQPRPYRNSRLPKKQVKIALADFLDHWSFNKIHFSKIDEIKNTIFTNALSALSVCQDQHTEAACFHPETAGFKLDGLTLTADPTLPLITAAHNSIASDSIKQTTIQSIIEEQKLQYAN